KNNIRKIVVQHRELQSSLENLNGRTIPIAMDEWNYWHRDYEYGELGCVYDLGDSLGVAAGLHEYFRQSDIIAMANYAQTVNVIGCIKTSKTAAEFATTGLVLKLYREVFGTIPINIEGEFGLYDISAAIQEDGGGLTIGIVNPTDETVDVQIDFKNAMLSGIGDHYYITGDGRGARNRSGETREVDIALDRGVNVSKFYSAPSLSSNIFIVSFK
ncbi:MAG: alpha-N-arabinofuranosidase, partial [Candidatus Pelagisphaera sp.]